MAAVTLKLGSRSDLMLPLESPHVVSYSLLVFLLCRYSPFKDCCDLETWVKVESDVSIRYPICGFLFVPKTFIWSI